MKKLLLAFSVIAILLSLSITASAGSIPMDLMVEDNAQIFFAQVVSVHTNEEKPYIEIIPKNVVKGDVTIDEKMVYYNPHAVYDFKIKRNKAYLFASFGKTTSNYILKVSSYDTHSLKIIGLEEEKGGMWYSVQQELNDGNYEKAEAKRRNKLGLEPLHPQPTSNLPALDTYNGPDTDILIYLTLIVGGTIVVGGLITLTVYLVLKAKRKSNK